MDNLQYKNNGRKKGRYNKCFKPYYKWIIFNIKEVEKEVKNELRVLNLIINR